MTTTQPLAAPLTATEDPADFAAALLSWMNAATVVLALDVGHRCGALEVVAERGPATSSELADGGSLAERQLREWLNLLTSAGVIHYDASTSRYCLPPAAAACLTGDSASNLAPATAGLAMLARHVGAVADTVRHGGGIPYEAYRPEFTGLMDEMNRARYDALLVDGYIAPVPGLVERLRAGVRVVDVGCGTGHAVNLLARAFPASHFTGYDLADDALDAARREAAAYALDNVRFERRDVTHLPATLEIDVALALDSIHDQAHPRHVLAGIRRVLPADGLFLMVDARASSQVENNIGTPMGPYVYGASLFHCMQVSLAADGEGLGTAWGIELAHELLAEAGFSRVEKFDAPPSDILNVIYACRP
jgi:SAM-dependent methyltransferase